MKFADLLKDKMMGVYIDIYRGGELLKSVYRGMRDGMFVVEFQEKPEDGEELTLRVTIGGWNLEFPCVLHGCQGSECFLKPKGKVKIREKRKEKRIPCIIPCEVNGVPGTVLDISAHGLRVLTLGGFDMGSDVSVTVAGNELTGRIRWIRDEEVDLKSVGILMDEPPEWWVEMVRGYVGKYLRALRRL